MQELVPAAALLLAAAIWGVTFPIVKDALNDIGTFEFLALRFGISAAVAAVIWPRAARDAFRVGVAGGALAGILLAAGHGFQTAGIELTRATNAGFITGLYVVFTPLLAAIFLRRRPPLIVIGGVLLVTIGLALMSLQLEGGRVGVNTGDMLVLVCAVAYGAQIVAVGHFAPEADHRVLTLQQFIVSTVVFTAIMPFEGVTSPNTSTVWIALLATALGSSVYGITAQVWAQQRIPPSRAAVIYSMEAPFAALAAYFLTDERLPTRAWVGAALILLGMLVVEVRPRPEVSTVDPDVQPRSV